MRYISDITDRVYLRKNSDGSTIDPATAQKQLPDNHNVTVTSQPLVKRTITVNQIGDTIVYTPTAGTAIRLYFFGYSAAAELTGVTVSLKLAGYNNGDAIDAQYLTAPGQPYARNIQGGKRYIEGSVDGALIVNLDAAQTVYVNFELEEV